MSHLFGSNYVYYKVNKDVTDHILFWSDKPDGSNIITQMDSAHDVYYLFAYSLDELSKNPRLKRYLLDAHLHDNNKGIEVTTNGNKSYIRTVASQPGGKMLSWNSRTLIHTLNLSGNQKYESTFKFIGFWSFAYDNDIEEFYGDGSTFDYESPVLTSAVGSVPGEFVWWSSDPAGKNKITSIRSDQNAYYHYDEPKFIEVIGDDVDGGGSVTFVSTVPYSKIGGTMRNYSLGDSDYGTLPETLPPVYRAGDLPNGGRLTISVNIYVHGGQEYNLRGLTEEAVLTIIPA